MSRRLEGTLQVIITFLLIEIGVQLAQIHITCHHFQLLRCDTILCEVETPNATKITRVGTGFDDVFFFSGFKVLEPPHRPDRMMYYVLSSPLSQPRWAGNPRAHYILRAAFSSFQPKWVGKPLTDDDVVARKCWRCI